MKNFPFLIMAAVLFMGFFAVLLSKEASWEASKRVQYGTEVLTGKIISIDKDSGHVTIQEENGVVKTFKTDPKEISYLKNDELIKVVLRSISNTAESVEILRS